MIEMAEHNEGDDAENVRDISGNPMTTIDINDNSPPHDIQPGFDNGIASDVGGCQER